MHRLARSLQAAAASSVLLLVAGITGPPAPALSAPACTHLEDSGVPENRIAALARGFNLTDWHRRADLAGIAPILRKLSQKGFSHIRLPVDGERLMTQFSQPGNRASYLARIDLAVTGLIIMGYAVTLDMHPGPAFQKLHRDNPDAGLTALTGAWMLAARRFRTLPADKVFFELLNEATVPVEEWHRQAGELIARLRKLIPEHTIIYGPGGYQRIDVLARLQPLTDQNVVYAVHYYDPLIFTHQGLDWAPDDPHAELAGIPFPAGLGDDVIKNQIRRLRKAGKQAAAELVERALDADWTTKRIARDIAAAGKWSITHRQPVIINEFGVLSWKAPARDRIRWIGTVAGAAAGNCIGWTHWEFDEAFGFVRETGKGAYKADTEMLRAFGLGDR